MNTDKPSLSLLTTRRAQQPRTDLRLGRRFGFAAAAFALAIGMLGTTLPTSLYPLYRQRFGFSELMITVIFATYAVGVIASLLLFGRLSDQIGRRRETPDARLVDAVVAGVADRVDQHEPHLGQDLQMLRDGRLGQPHRGHDLAGLITV